MLFVFPPALTQSLYSAVDGLRDSKADRDLLEMEVGGVNNIILIPRLSHVPRQDSLDATVLFLLLSHDLAGILR